MKWRSLRAICAGWAMAIAMAGGMEVCAQGTFTNLETPQVKPVTTAVVRDGDAAVEVVLVCNTPDNSVEIYQAAPPHAFLQRVPVGMGPCTVRWSADLSRFYTCNFDGDTVSTARLDLVPGPGGPTVLASLEATSAVGDQPSDIAVNAESNTAFVTLSGRSSFITLNATTLAIIAGESVLEGDEPLIAPTKLAVKAPRGMEWLDDNRIFVINHMGESADPMNPLQYDLDLWYFDPGANPVINHVKGLGSTNHNFAIDQNGDHLVMVGTKARNHDAVGEAAVAALTFGFVESRFWVIDIPAGGTPVVHPEAPSGVIPTAPLPSRNLNRNYTIAMDTPVVPGDALSQPTDVVIIPRDDGGIQSIVITAYHSDKIALFTPASVPGGYTETQIALPVMNPGQSYSTSGPRGLAYSERTGLLYVACRLDNTLRVVNPTSSAVTDIQLANDPTPVVIRSGRQFLYNATISSTSGFVSCGSCHIDGTTDALDWDLGELAIGAAIPPGLLGSGDPSLFPNWPSEKGPLITQTLQGLVNYPVNLQAEYLFTNAPYHWRGDRANFQAFNPAFVGLLGRSDPLDDDVMDLFTAFINTVRHPPNPEQAIDRIVPGTLDASDPDDWTLASGSKLGLQIFYNNESDAGRSCDSCHRGPEGSDNTLTEAFLVEKTITNDGTNQAQPFETAALRNLVPREIWLHRAPGLQTPFYAVANVGLTHDGNVAQGSINFFNNFFFSTTVPGTTPDEVQSNLEAVTKYTREYDWSIAPGAGLAYTLSRGTPALNTVAFDYFEGQVEDANIGLAVLLRQGAALRGFWYDITANPAAYREEGTANLFTRGQISSFVTGPDTSVILQGTPLGSERRVANPAGVATLISDPSQRPTNVTPLPMAPMSYNTDVPLFDDFLHIDQSVMPPVVTAPTIQTLWALRTLQLSVLGNFGVNTLHHEPPRRFRVTGDNIRAGAKLLVGVPTTTPGNFPVQVLELDLFPTIYVTDDGDQIWESEEEVGSLVQFALLNGGPFAPDVANVALRQTTTPNLQPLVWNSFGFAILNEDGSINSTIPFAPLTVQDTR